MGLASACSCAGDERGVKLRGKQNMIVTRLGGWLALYSSAGLDGVRGSIAVALIGILLSVHFLTLLIFSAPIEMLVASVP